MEESTMSSLPEGLGSPYTAGRDPMILQTNPTAVASLGTLYAEAKLLLTVENIPFN